MQYLQFLVVALMYFYTLPYQFQILGTFIFLEWLEKQINFIPFNISNFMDYLNMFPFPFTCDKQNLYNNDRWKIHIVGSYWIRKNAAKIIFLTKHSLYRIIGTCANSFRMT